jgi:hypothetical protein
MAVKEELKKLIYIYGCRFRRVEIMENITMDQRLQLKSALLDSGLELMDDKKSMLIERRLKIIIQMVHHSTENIKLIFLII